MTPTSHRRQDPTSDARSQQHAGKYRFSIEDTLYDGPDVYMRSATARGTGTIQRAEGHICCTSTPMATQLQNVTAEPGGGVRASACGSSSCTNAWHLLMARTSDYDGSTFICASSGERGRSLSGSLVGYRRDIDPIIVGSDQFIRRIKVGSVEWIASKRRSGHEPAMIAPLPFQLGVTRAAGQDEALEYGGDITITPSGSGRTWGLPDTSDVVRTRGAWRFLVFSRFVRRTSHILLRGPCGPRQTLSTIPAEQFTSVLRLSWCPQRLGLTSVTMYAVR